jgi:hypothetical protein
MTKSKRERAALAIAPSYEAIEPDKDAYVQPLYLRPLAKEYRRFWSFHSMPTTVALPGNRFAKSLKGFTSHTDEASFRELLRETSEHGVQRPSGYADIFHEKFHSPSVTHSVNSQLAPALAGGWQAAIKPGKHSGTFYRYDMRSAYLWAATLGMPNAYSYQRSLSPWKDRYRDGVYRIKVLRPSPLAPFPFDRAMECLASSEEIEHYNLPVAEVIDGVAWDGLIDPKPIIDAISCVSFWKQAGRSYWGRWAQMTRVQCHSPNKKWNLPNTTLNVPWAHTIVSRVKMRLWEHASNALHVFVDSVITPDVIKTGTGLGDWRLEKTYDNGVIIRGPGQYGDASSDVLEKMAGTAFDSPLRYNPVALGA